MSAPHIEWRPGRTTGAQYEEIPCIDAYVNGKHIGYYLPCSSSIYASRETASFLQSFYPLPHARATYYEKDIQAFIQKDIDKLYAWLTGDSHD
jgi:hypothetical protein